MAADDKKNSGGNESVMFPNDKEEFAYRQRDKDGMMFYKTNLTSSVDDLLESIVLVEPDRVIPVVFLPGIMGSNLISSEKQVWRERNIPYGKNESGFVEWRPDDETTMGVHWATTGPQRRKETMQADKTKVSRDGLGVSRGAEILGYSKSFMKFRGWGEVANMSYIDTLIWLERELSCHADPKVNTRERLPVEKPVSGQLNQTHKNRLVDGEDKLSLTTKDIARSYKYQFPVHAFGYNWLQTNAEAGSKLATRIDDIIKHYQKQGQRCAQVILVTHSMGGYVARYCSEVAGMKDQILGVVHGVMPATGAPTVYRRMKAGSADAGFPASLVIGKNAANVHAVMANSPGPLELLPSIDYNDGEPWLHVQDKGRSASDGSLSLPRDITKPDGTVEKANPYTQIYLQRDKWWGLCDDRLINSLDTSRKKRTTNTAQVNADWDKYETTITTVEDLHDKISKQYHKNTHMFYGRRADLKAYGSVVWRMTEKTEKPHNMYGHTYGESTDPVDIMGSHDITDYDQQVWETRELRVPGRDNPKQEYDVTMKISAQDADGDGTVAYQSGSAPIGHAHVHSAAIINGEHGATYAMPKKTPDDSLPAREHVLRCIVRFTRDLDPCSYMRYD